MCRGGRGSGGGEHGLGWIGLGCAASVEERTLGVVRRGVCLVTSRGEKSILISSFSS